MNTKKMFAFVLEDKLKERLKIRGKKYGVSMAHQINRAIEFQLNRDEQTEERIKKKSEQ